MRKFLFGLFAIIVAVLIQRDRIQPSSNIYTPVSVKYLL